MIITSVSNAGDPRLDGLNPSFVGIDEAAKNFEIEDINGYHFNVPTILVDDHIQLKPYLSSAPVNFRNKVKAQMKSPYFAICTPPCNAAIQLSHVASGE